MQTSMCLTLVLTTNMVVTLHTAITTMVRVMEVSPEDMRTATAVVAATDSLACLTFV